MSKLVLKLNRSKMTSVTLSKSTIDLSKLVPLDETNYKCWSQKLLIFFETCETDYILTADPAAYQCPPSSSSSLTTADGTVSTDDLCDAQIAKYEKDNKWVRGQMLNHMTNKLFDLFVHFNSAKEIWEKLEKKYGADDAGKKKYDVGNWLNF